MEVSVLITTYNHEKYIAQAVDSVLMQKTDFEYEIIIGEDCSTDRTRSIVLDFQRRNPGKIRLLLPVANLGKGRNKIFPKLVEMAEGHYIAILDGDDYWTAFDKLQKQVDFLRQHPECAMCFHDVVQIREDGRPSSWVCTPPGRQPVTSLEDLLRGNFVVTSAVMVQRKLCLSMPSWVYEIALEDWAFHVLNAQHGKVGYLDEVMGVYRKHRGGLWSRRTRRQMREGEIEFYQYVQAQLGPRYQEIIKIELAKRHALLLQDKTREKVDDWVERMSHDAQYQELAARIRAVAHLRLPSDPSVIIVGGLENLLLQLNARQSWSFPPIEDSEQERLFAEGSHGTKEVPWLRDGFIYEFRLYAGKERRRRLASVNLVCVSDSDRPLGESRLANPEMIFASNSTLAPPRIDFANRAVSWNTGNGSSGQVYVALKNVVDIPNPIDDVAAIGQLKGLMHQGAEFLLAPRNALTFFERYPELKDHLDHHYRLVEDDEVCRIYDLREMPQKPATTAERPEIKIEIA